MSPGAELYDRVFLARVLEPGDEAAGRWLREAGVREVAGRLRGKGRRFEGISERRWAGLLRGVGIDTDRNERIADESGDTAVAVRRTVHLVAPVAP